MIYFKEVGVMKKNKIAKLIGMAGASMMALAFLALPVSAGVVEPSGLEDITDKKAIQQELDETGSVTLVDGGVYYLSNILYVSSNQSIEATGATIYAKEGFLCNNPEQANYQGLVNFSVNGGNWLSKEEEGRAISSMRFAHGSNLKFTNIYMKHTNYDGHGLELIGCKDVLVENCTFLPLGTPGHDAVAEMIQIDLAAPSTAPTLKKSAPQLVNGAPCQNITIRNCEVEGNRGICANYANKDTKYRNKFHSNIVIENCNITGACSEGLALFNVKSATVKNNTIISKNSKVADRAVGLHIGLFGKGTMKNITVSNNTLKGKWLALQIWSEAGAKYKKITIKNNKMYAKKKKATFNLPEDYYSYVAKKMTMSKNKNYKYK